MYEQYNEQAAEILAKLSLEERVGQLFIGRCPGEGKDDRGAAVEDLSTYRLGGYTLFAYDFENKTPGIIKENVRAWQDAATLPLLLAVDEEGGRVTRISQFEGYGHEHFRAPCAVYAAGGLREVARDTEEKADFLHRLGLNFNYAPVCDMSSSKENFIFDRTVGLDAAGTAAYIDTVVRAMNEKRLIGALKHFPGYGDNLDTHQMIARDDRTLADFTEKDLKPFLAGIAAGAPVVMVAHNTVTCFDRENPASLSPAVHGFLRNDLGFDGVIMTDSLDMNAITLFAGEGRAAVLAIKGGNDLLCCTSYRIQVPAVLAAVASGEIQRARIDESVLRILKLKLAFGIIQ